MPDARFTVEVVRGVPVVAAPEEIDITNAEALRAALLAAADGHGTLVVDMTQTRFCDSSGLHVLIAAHRRDPQLHQPGRGPGASARRRERPRAPARRRRCPCRRPGGTACRPVNCGGVVDRTPVVLAGLPGSCAPPSRCAMPRDRH